MSHGKQNRRRSFCLCSWCSDNLLQNQWCKLTLTSWFWATKVYLQASKNSKICLFGCSNGQATSWKANFENYSRYSLIKWYQFLSVQNRMTNTSFHLRHMFLLPIHSYKSHTTYLNLRSHHLVNNKCNRVKGQHWRWLMYALCKFL